MKVREWIGLPMVAVCTMAHGEQVVPVGRGVDIRDVLVPGPELRVRKSRGLADPILLRITATYPHGTLGFRYDFHCVPMVAGKHDLGQYLETASGEPLKGVEPITVEATAVLPAGPPGELKEVPFAAVPKAGGYEAMIPYGVALWAAAGLGGMWFFRKRKLEEAQANAAAPPTVAEQVRSLLERAVAQPLDTSQWAQLERLLLAHGREQLRLPHATDPAVWRALREDPNTASWLRTLEAWLHRPSASAPSPEEVRELLARIP